MTIAQTDTTNPIPPAPLQLLVQNHDFSYLEWRMYQAPCQDAVKPIKESVKAI
jgi:hypothetical protein